MNSRSLVRQHAAGRIVRRVDDDHFRLGETRRASSSRSMRQLRDSSSGIACTFACKIARRTDAYAG